MAAHGERTARESGPRFLVVMDADSTFFRDEVIELLADKAGSRPAVAAITEAAMRGELDFAASLTARVRTLAGLSGDDIDQVSRQVRVTPGARELIDGVQAAGGAVGVVSGGFLEVLDGYAIRFGLDHWHANRLEMRDGRLTGQVSGAIVDANAKAEALKRWAREDDIPMSGTVVIGDGANDLVMMREAALSVAFCAKPVVRAAADVTIDKPDLSPVLALLGLRG
jgi:phosphoserine phosphatase